jgi:hypothetical protein
MLISILLACCALAVGAPAAALGADVPLPISAAQVQQKVAEVQHAAPAVSAPPAAEKVVRDAVPAAAAAPAAKQVRERVRDVVAPAATAVPVKPAAAHSEPVEAGSGASAVPRNDVRRGAHHAKRARSAHATTGGKRAAESTSSHAPRATVANAPVKDAATASAARPAPSHDDAPRAPELPGISAGAAAGVALAGGLLAVLLAGFGTSTVRRPLKGFLCLPPAAALCSAIERPG